MSKCEQRKFIDFLKEVLRKVKLIVPLIKLLWWIWGFIKKDE
jgi:hypothetical protein